AWWRDVRYGARQLRRNPLFAAIAIASFALGIGANSVIFCAAKAVLFDTLPVSDPHELRMLTWVSGHDQPASRVWGDVWSSDGGAVAGNVFSFAAYEAMAQNRDAFQGIVAFKDVKMTATVDGLPQLTAVEMISGSAFSFLGVKPVLGRTLTRLDDAEPGKGTVALVSEEFWAMRLARSQSVLGQSMVLNGVPVTIVGVVPARFEGLQMGSIAQVFVPLTMQPVLAPRAQLGEGGSPSLLGNPQSWWINILVRLRPDMPEARTEAALNLNLRQIAAKTWPDGKGMDQFRLRLERGDRGLDSLRGEFAQASYLLLALAGLVLLLACVNVANLVLARGASRNKEMGTRVALGAGRAQLLRQVLTESLLLSTLGGAAGLGLGFLGRHVIPNLLGGRQTIMEARFDWRVLGFTALISVATGILTGILPARQAMFRNLRGSLQGSGQGSGQTSSASRIGKVLVITQISLSTMLLIGAGLFVRTLVNLRQMALGFRADHLLMFTIDPPRTRYSDEQMTRLYGQLEERLSAIPGIRAVSLSNIAIVGEGYSGTDIRLPGRAGEEQRVQINGVGVNFFATMDIPILQGRGFSVHDTSHSPTVAVVNQTMARKLFPDQNPLGQVFEADEDDAKGPIQIVGIAADTRYADLRSATPPLFYLPYQQQPNASHMVVEVHTAGEPGALAREVRDTLESLDPALPMIDVRTMTEQIAGSLAQERILAHLTTGFGLLALALASIGVYGVMAYAVSQRTREIGLRMALGETPRSVIWRVMREGLGLLGTGLIAGIALSLALSRFIAAQLFGVRATDLRTYVAAIGLLSLVALVSSFVPARRASTIDPLTTLRYE
ncbi:MAG: ABC transporter permease, partial [Acidobacteriaceae bacterium]